MGNKKTGGATSITQAAATLGSRGGDARKNVLTETQKSNIASQGARARNAKHGNPNKGKHVKKVDGK